jgi:transposase
MLDIYTHAARLNDDYSGIEVVGIDETSIARGHKYISLFVDLHKKKTIFITTGKDSQTVADFSLDLEPIPK